MDKLSQVQNPSLLEVYKSVPITGTGWRRFFSFVGPGYLVAVGYMDPGNWATSITGGAQFGYALLFVALLSNFMAIILQSLCARLAIATGRDLAQASHENSPLWLSRFLWIMAELAIIATDLAEIIGTAIGLQLLFGLSLSTGVMITILDTFLILWLQSRGFRKIEVFVGAMLFIIFASFAAQLYMVQPVWGDVAKGFLPTTKIISDPAMLYIAIGIIGATVMPHNLYLHSAIVQTRNYSDKKEALKFATIDSTIALMLALLINASILIVAAAAFHAKGQTDVTEIGKAHELLAPLLGSTAPMLFAIALICCGLNSTVTATIAGQVVMEGFIQIRLKPWLRRLITRSIAIIPAVFVTLYYGESQTAKLLIASQVVLGLQLPFAIVPLIIFTSSKAKMGALKAPTWLVIVSSIIAMTIIALNIKLIYDLI
jgi:manganese transport protein